MEMEEMLYDGQAAQVGNWNKEQSSPHDKHEQVSCSGNDDVMQEKSESSLTPGITQALTDNPLHTQSGTLELCWYCLKSMSVEELNIHQVEGEAQTLPSSGERLKYQRDPRPHFGVAHSSRSVSFPLWDAERRGEMTEEEDEDEEGVESVGCCPHCHLWLPRDTLLWHEAKCLLYEVKNS